LSSTISPTDYWTTPEGLKARIDAIAHNHIYGATNQTLLAMANEIIPIDEEAYEWDTEGDTNVCDECQDNEDNGPYLGDDVPDFPAHVGCRCQLSINPGAVTEAAQAGWVTLADGRHILIGEEEENPQIKDLGKEQTLLDQFIKPERRNKFEETAKLKFYDVNGKKVKVSWTRIPLAAEENRVKASLEKIPKTYLRGVRVRVISAQDTVKSQVFDSRTGGYRNITAVGHYQQMHSGGKVTLQGEVVRMQDESDRVIVHEVGHHVFATKLGVQNKLDWVSFWKTHHDDMPNSYAQHNENEGFAESFMYYYVKPGELAQWHRPVYDWFLKWRGKTVDEVLAH
jgi:hypothetical protein